MNAEHDHGSGHAHDAARAGAHEHAHRHAAARAPTDDGITTDLVAFVRSSLPDPPARVLEIGAGSGELARRLRNAGYEVTAIDPSAQPGSGVEPVPLLEADGEFDGAVAVVSLHHVEPLAQSLAHLAGLLVPGARLVIDELDVDRCDERALGWWLAQRTALCLGYPHNDAPDTDAPEPEKIVAEMRTHIHSLSTVRATLSTHFEIGESVRGAYLHRWALAPSLREPELQQIADGQIPAVGARMIAIRR